MGTFSKYSLAALIAASLLLSACQTEKVEVMKSPCAGIAGSPCGPKRWVNEQNG